MDLFGLFTSKETNKVIAIDSKIRALAFLSNDCIVSGEESSVQLRRLGNLMGEPIESSTGVLAVAASSDGSRIVTGTADGFAIWSRLQGEVARDPVARRPIGGVRTIDISLDSKWVITGSDSRTADVWDLSTGERRPGLGPLKHEYNVIAVKFCPCGERIATATLFGSVRIFATSSGQKLFTIPISVTATIPIPNVTFAWFVLRPQIFAVSQGQIKCLNSDDGSLIYQWALRGVTHPSSVVLSPNSKLIAYSINDTVILRDTDTRQEVGGSLKHDGDVSCIAFSPGSNLLMVGADTKFTIWNLPRLLNNASYFKDTADPFKSCARHNEDPTRKPPPTTFSLPLMSISNGAVKGWLHGFLDHAEKVFSTEIEDPKFVSNHDIFANRALIRGRLGKGDLALEDAQKSLSIQQSPIGQIAKTIAFIKIKQPEGESRYALARQEIPKVLQSGHSDQHTFLLEVIRSILSCLSGEYESETSHINTLSGDKKLLWLVQANMHLSEKCFESAMESFDKARVPAIFPHDETREMWTISFIFGWKFSGLAIQIQQRKCEFLLDAGDPQSADLFVELRSTYQREIAMHVELADWSSKFRKDCLAKLEYLGDQALEAKKWSEAIKHFKAVEPLIGDLDAKHQLLLKRSKAHSEIPENWREALQDAEEAIKLNPTSPWGYEVKHKVLHARRYYREAAEALDQMLQELTFSKDAKSTALREKGVDPMKTKKIILGVAEETLTQPRPQILINTESGRLCEKPRQMEAFRAHPRYKALVLSPTSEISPDGVWRETVWQYFEYSTFSHTWEDQDEPSFRDVEGRTVESLDQEKITIQKLQTFCKITHGLGYWWAWSDTCCINKADKETLDVALRSMYRWYSGSSLTIVHLKGVDHQLAVDLATLLQIMDQDLDKLLKDFVECRWNKRAWTLQEYFASRVIHFYTEKWEPYLPIDTNSLTNHKVTRAIQRGMQLVTGLDAARLAALKPGSGDVREKLRLASAREARRREDTAYSLLGIFKVTIEAIYGDDEVPRAFGRLLGALLTQSADVSILAWTGTSSEYNTCLPAEITVYRDPDEESRYLPSPIEETRFAELVSAMHSSMTPAALNSAIRLHDRLLDAPPPELHHGRLKLSCILFQLPAVTWDPISRRYTGTAEMLGKVEIEAEEDSDLSTARNMFLVSPWFRRLMNPGIPLSESARQASALKLLASLKQPFGALLLAWTSRDYERIAADKLITVKLREDVSTDQIMENIRVLYIR